MTNLASLSENLKMLPVVDIAICLSDMTPLKLGKSSSLATERRKQALPRRRWRRVGRGQPRR
jgi:hypothetical protein